MEETVSEEFDGTQSVGIEDGSDAADTPVGGIEDFVMAMFQKSRDARRTDETRWLQAYRNYRGVYDPETVWSDEEKSRIFVKVTKTKVLAAFGQLCDVLFNNGKLPISIEPTTLPEGVSDAVHFDMQPVPEEGSAELQPGETTKSFMDRLGALDKKLSPVADELKEGPGRTETAITVHPAFVTAKKMEKKILDQMEEADAGTHLRKAVFEGPLYGSMILKGPFVTEKEYPKWNEKGEYEPVKETVPSLSSVSCWNSYPDMDADCADNMEYFIERHKLQRSQLRRLKKRPMFREDAIDRALAAGEQYNEEWWESVLKSEEETGHPVNRFEAFEFWGFVDTDLIVEQGVDVGDLKDEEQLQVNVWIVNGEVIRLVLNPFTPKHIPYHISPYEMNPYSIFGIGVGENMSDTQAMMNGFMRMAIDNAALSGNLLVEIDRNALEPGQDFKIHPGKVFVRQSGAPGQAVFGTKFPNVSNENMQMFDKARQLADESTGLPSFAHGQTGVQGTGRTAAGISMLMGAANGSIKTVIKNVDDYLLGPIARAFFRFNMQFNFEEEFAQGDLEVKARGTESLMSNEVRSQRLMQFLSVVQNPILAPFAKMDYIIAEIAKSLDLDPEKVTNSLADSAIQAKLMQKFQGDMAAAQDTGDGGPPGVSDPTGAGNSNIGVGVAPQPGEAGHSANAPTTPPVGMPQ